MVLKLPWRKFARLHRCKIKGLLKKHKQRKQHKQGGNDNNYGLEYDGMLGNIDLQGHNEALLLFIFPLFGID